MATKDALTKLQQVLSHPTAGLVVLFLAMAGRVLQVLFFFNIRSDRSFQLLATDSFLEGHGISTAQVLATDLSTTLYEPLIKWPPGYSLLVAPFYWLWGRDYLAAALTLDIISALAFVLLCRSIARRLHLPPYLVNGLTLTAGLFIYAFYFISSSDAIGITLFLAGLYPALILLQRGERGLRYGAWIGAALLACGLFKYVFLPAVFVIPLFLMVKGFLDKQAALRRGGFVSLAVLTVGLGVLFLYQSAVSTNAEYISDAKAGFYPENVLAAYPFLPASFIKPDTVAKLTGLGGQGEAFVIRLFQGVHLLLLFVVVVVIIRMMYRQGRKKLAVTEGFFYFCFFTSLAVVGLLALLSLRYKKAEELPGFWWTYIQEPRYYGLPNVLLHLAVFALYQYGKGKRSGTLRYTAGVLLLVLFVEVCRGGLFVGSRVWNLGKEEYSWQYENRFQKYAAGVMAKAQKEHGVERSVVTSPSYYYANRVALYAHVPTLQHTDAINEGSSLATQEPVLLLVLLHQNDSSRFGAFLSQYGRRPAGIFEDYSFYTVYVTPR
jgi:hypothetical protein